MLWHLHILKDITIQKKFVKDGKACIQFPKRCQNIMISNCPPNKLAAFLKCLMVKRVCNQQEKPMGERARLLSELPRKFQEISPLTERDVQTVNSVRSKKVELSGTATTPAPSKRKGLKRARENNTDNTSQVREKNEPVWLCVKVFCTSALEETLMEPPSSM